MMRNIFITLALLSSVLKNADALASGLCPVPADIAPCYCIESPVSATESTYIMDCSQATTNEQITEAFQADFPTTEYYQLRIETPTVLTEFTFSTGDVTFTYFYLHNPTLTSLSRGIFDPSAAVLATIEIEVTQLTEFPFEALSDYPVIGTVDISQSKIAEITPITSNSLFKLSLTQNSISTLRAGKIAFFKT